MADPFQGYQLLTLTSGMFHEFSSLLWQESIASVIRNILFSTGWSFITSLSLETVQALLKYFRAVTDLDLIRGVVEVIQTFGDRFNFVYLKLDGLEISIDLFRFLSR